MKKNSIGQSCINQFPGKKLKFEGKFVNFLDNPPEEMKDENGLLFAIMLSAGPRKKDRKLVRMKRNYNRFLNKCKKCMSKNKDFCEDMEVSIEKMWNYGKYTFGSKIDRHNCRCSFFVNKETHSHVK